MSSVREATIRDIDRVVELWAEHVDFHGDLDPRFKRGEGSETGFRDHLLRNLGKAEFLILVAEAEDEIVGFLHGELLQDPPCFAKRTHGFISDLAVSPHYQRAGFGTALLEEGMAWFSERGVSTVEGKVLMSNPKAVGFWKRAGFDPFMQTFRASTIRGE
jgi:ribosomal protein S18 acetylase RimI-like enzyme